MQSSPHTEKNTTNSIWKLEMQQDDWWWWLSEERHFVDKFDDLSWLHNLALFKVVDRCVCTQHSTDHQLNYHRSSLTFRSLWSNLTECEKRIHHRFVYIIFPEGKQKATCEHWNELPPWWCYRMFKLVGRNSRSSVTKNQQHRVHFVCCVYREKGEPLESSLFGPRQWWMFKEISVNVKSSPEMRIQTPLFKDTEWMNQVYHVSQGYSRLAGRVHSSSSVWAQCNKSSILLNLTA